MSQPRRNWTLARTKVDREGCCRNCGATASAEAAHVVGRQHDFGAPVRDLGIKFTVVHPDRIIPLCGECHRAEHRHELDTLPLLTLDEQLQAVADAGGIEQARIRTCPSQYRAERAA